MRASLMASLLDTLFGSLNPEALASSASIRLKYMNLRPVMFGANFAFLYIYFRY